MIIYYCTLLVGRLMISISVDYGLAWSIIRPELTVPEQGGKGDVRLVCQHH